MKNPLWIVRKVLVPLLLIIFGTACQQSQKTSSMKAPVAEKIEKELTLHGHTRIDPYYWLRERDDPRVIEYLNAENEY